MLLNILAVIAGFAILIWGADRFVLGASATARNLGVPPLIIGLTVVGFGTSAPEMLVSGLAAWNGNPGISIGNALGSNIANIGLVIGVTAIVGPISVHSNTLRREFPLLFIFMMLALLLLVDGYLSFSDGVILILGMFFMLFWLTRIAMRSRITDPMQEDFAEEIPLHMPMWKASLWLLLGLGLLLLGSRLVVYGAVEIAQWFGISDLVIGLTIIAIGTSLPELAATVVCILKKEDDLAVGNVVGSNMFNILAVMGIPGLIMPFTVPSEALTRDFTVMFVLTIIFFMMSYGFGGNGRITRIKGAALVASFAAYMLYLGLYSI